MAGKGHDNPKGYAECIAEIREAAQEAREDESIDSWQAEKYELLATNLLHFIRTPLAEREQAMRDMRFEYMKMLMNGIFMRLVRTNDPRDWLELFKLEQEGGFFNTEEMSVDLWVYYRLATGDYSWECVHENPELELELYNQHLPEIVRMYGEYKEESEAIARGETPRREKPSQVDYDKWF